MAEPDTPTHSSGVDEHLLALVDAMVHRRPVLVLIDLRNGTGEVAKTKGWRTRIREIRRPAEDVLAYGHLDPVVVVEGDPNDPDHGRGLSICLQPAQVALDPGCGCSEPDYCRRTQGVHLNG